MSEREAEFEKMWEKCQRLQEELREWGEAWNDGSLIANDVDPKWTEHFNEKARAALKAGG